MKFIKKIWITTLGILAIFAINLWYCLKTWPEKEGFNPDDTGSPQITGHTITDIDDWSRTFSKTLEWILHLPVKDNYTTSLWYVIALIQIIVNWTLAMLSVVALVYMLYCGFLVFTAWSNDKNASKGKKWLSTGAIAIAWIAISWLIVSAMIRIIWYVSVSVN